MTAQEEANGAVDSSTARPVLIWESLLLLDHRWFALRASEDLPHDAGSYDPNEWIATLRGQVVVTVAGYSDPSLRIEVWRHPALDSPTGEWQDCRDFSVEFPFGTVTVNQNTNGPAVRDLFLPDGPGTYSGRIWSANRDSALDRWNQLIDETDEDSFDERRAELEGYEAYIVRLWPSRDADD